MKARILMLSCLCSLAMHVGDAAASDNTPPPKVPGWHWAWSHTATFNGARIEQYAFQLAAAPVQAARQLLDHADFAFDRLMIVRGDLVLSGLHRGQHWLAWLRADRRGTHGLLSVLTPQLAGVQGFDAAGYLPHRRPALIHSTQYEAGKRLSLSAYEQGPDVAMLQSHLGLGLDRAGWRTTTSTWPGGHAWRRAGEMLQWRVQRDGVRSVIWFWHEQGDGS
ncbi:MAG TPA: hypothetical protein VL024_02785 [Castellaniella sp.]|nr:hypothetical protein [Castellaniella sp.]